ncbi:MAG: bifunctional nuclease family protein [Thermodesulfobacteriota bacterium]
MLLEMSVHGIALDPFTNVPIVILKDEKEEQTLPIWIGVLEASAIATELEKLSFSRPMTHDLLNEILKTTKVEVSRIEVTDLKENVYYAKIYMDSAAGGELVVDARPSDAIAVALRANCPILVDAGVLEKSKSIDMRGSSGESLETDEWLEMLEDLSPEDFGKYKM